MEWRLECPFWWFGKFSFCGRSEDAGSKKKSSENKQFFNEIWKNATPPCRNESRRRIGANCGSSCVIIFWPWSLLKWVESSKTLIFAKTKSEVFPLWKRSLACLMFHLVGIFWKLLLHQVLAKMGLEHVHHQPRLVSSNIYSSALKELDCGVKWVKSRSLFEIEI